MKKILLTIAISGLLLSSCLPAFFQPSPSNSTPVSETDLQATAAVLSQQTLQALPTATIAPSNTPVVAHPTNTATLSVLTQTATLTLTGTLSTSAPNASGTTTTSTLAPGGTLPVTMTKSVTPNFAISVTATETLHPQHYGTMPPYLPFGQVILVNKSKAEVYVSLQCTTKDGYKTIIESPITGTTKLKAPAGKYIIVAWVGGKKMIGNFSLGQSKDLKIKIFKDHLEIGS